MNLEAKIEESEKKKKKKGRQLPGVEPRTPLAWAASALPLSHDSRTLSFHFPIFSPHNIQIHLFPAWGKMLLAYKHNQLHYCFWYISHHNTCQQTPLWYLESMDTNRVKSLLWKKKWEKETFHNWRSSYFCLQPATPHSRCHHLGVWFHSSGKWMSLKCPLQATFSTASEQG